MFTTRMSPKMSEKPLATMNRRPANVIPFRSVTKKLRGSWIAGSKFVFRATKRTQMSANATAPNAIRSARGGGAAASPPCSCGVALRGRERHGCRT